MLTGVFVTQRMAYTRPRSSPRACCRCCRCRWWQPFCPR